MSAPTTPVLATTAVAVEIGVPRPVLGGAPLGGHAVAVGPAHLAAARDPVPRQVRRAVGTNPNPVGRTHSGEVVPP